MLCDNLGGGMEWERREESSRGGDMCIPMAD